MEQPQYLTKDEFNFVQSATNRILADGNLGGARTLIEAVIALQASREQAWSEFWATCQKFDLEPPEHKL